MFCEKCGNKLPDDSLFCDKCGAKVSDAVPAAGAQGGGAVDNVLPVAGLQRSGSMENAGVARNGGNAGDIPPVQSQVPQQMSQAQAVQNLPKGITVDGNGNYRWTYKLDMIKVPVLRNIIMKIIFFSCLGVGAFIGLINLIQGEDLDVILTGAGIMAIVGLVILVITFVVYYIVISIHGRYYTVDHLMNEEGVEHIQSPEEDAQSDKMRKLVFVLELLDPDPAAMGLAMAGQEHLISKYQDVKKVVAARRYGLIKVNNALQHNHIYAYPEQYEFVWNYITRHCPNAKTKG